MASRFAARRVFVLAIGAVAGLAASAHAETIDVPRDHATIQAAVDAAHAGDVITVETGTYRENVVVGGTDRRDVQIYAADAVVIEGQGTAPAVTFSGAVGVGMHGFTVTSGGDGVLVTDSGDVTVDGLTAQDCAGAGFRVDSSRQVTLATNLVTGAGGSAAVISDSGLVRVDDNVFTGAAADGLTVTGGSDVFLCGNRITDCGGSGVSCTGVQRLVVDETHVDEVTGDAVTVSDSDDVRILVCEFGDNDPETSIGGDAVHVDSSDRVRVQDNAIVDASGGGVVATESSVTVQSNKILDAGGAAIDVGGTADSYVGENVVARPGGSGIVVSGDSSTIDDNRISHAGGDGIVVLGSNDEVGSNVVTHPADDGVRVSNAAGDAGVVVQDNTITRPGASGLDLGAACHCDVTGNTVTRARENGIEMTTGYDNVLDDNRATRSRRFDLFEGLGLAANDVRPTNRFPKANKRHHLRRR